MCNYIIKFVMAIFFVFLIFRVFTICELYNQICHVNSKNCVNCVLCKIHVAFHKLCFCVIVIFILQDNFILNCVVF